MAKVSLEHITMDFGTVAALKDFSIEAGDGEFLVLLGPAGAGKTTTLKILAGLLKPTRGRVYFDGNDVTDIPANRRNVAMTFEDYALYPTYSVYDNLKNPFNVADPRPSKETVNSKILDIAKMLQIDHLLERQVDQLSGGQKQRVAMARSMVRQPALFLFDEPLSHVDAKIKHSMRAELHRLGSLYSTTTIYVTHDYVEALALGDRIAVIDQGVIQQIGTPHEIYNRPVNEFVATVVGQPTMNFFTCNVRQKDADISFQVVSNPDLTFDCGSISVDWKNKYLGQELKIGIRPQNIQYRFNKENGQGTEGIVSFFEPWGQRTMIMVAVGASEICLLTRSEEELEVGQPVWLDLFDSDLYVFDDTGNCIL